MALGAACAVLPGLAQAELDDSDFFGALVRTRPAYDGSASQVGEALPVLRYFGHPAFVRTSQGMLEGGGRWEMQTHLHAGLQLAYEAGREASESHFLAAHHVPDVSHGASAGAFVEWDPSLGPVPLSVLVRGRQQTRLDRGAQADIRLNAGVYGGRRIDAEVFAQASWATARSNASLYGVTPGESTITGLAPFAPGSAWSSLSGGLNAIANLTKHWFLVGTVERHWLPHGIGASPLAERGSNTLASLGLAYRP